MERIIISNDMKLDRIINILGNIFKRIDKRTTNNGIVFRRTATKLFTYNFKKIKLSDGIIPSLRIVRVKRTLVLQSIAS